MTHSPRIRAIMLDWAGTTVDHGSIAPVTALQTLFRAHGIALSTADARRDMGLLKRDHIRSILAMPHIRAQWIAIEGREPGEAEVYALFDEFGPLQINIITEQSQLIRGVAEAVRDWQSRGIRIGSTTGYTRPMLAPVLAQAAQQGYRPDASVCPDEVRSGRPAPWMLMKNAELLDVYPPRGCVKIGDTVVDIEEGKNAGMWTIGITRTGNFVGLNQDEWDQLSNARRNALLADAEDVLRTAGADFIAEDLASCDPVLSVIEERFRQ